MLQELMKGRLCPSPGRVSPAWLAAAEGVGSSSPAMTVGWLLLQEALTPHLQGAPPPTKASRVLECRCLTKGWSFPLSLETLWPHRCWWIPSHVYPIPGRDTRVRPLAGSEASGGVVPPSVPCWVPPGCIP